jgi:hypothetical protein
MVIITTKGIAASHTRFEGSLSVLVGRHGAMNPAERARCKLWELNKMGQPRVQLHHQKPAFFV